MTWWYTFTCATMQWKCQIYHLENLWLQIQAHQYKEWAVLLLRMMKILCRLMLA